MTASKPTAIETTGTRRLEPRLADDDHVAVINPVDEKITVFALRLP